MVTDPVFVVGLGSAGVSVLTALADSGDGTAESGHIEYFAIDTDTRALAEAPDGTIRQHLPSPSDFAAGDLLRYPFLTEAFSPEGPDSDRQRPVGRYRLDNRGTPSFGHIYRGLYATVSRFVAARRRTLAARMPEQVTLCLVHSLAGGTGGGAFPLVAAMLARIGDAMAAEFDVDASTFGVGLCPRCSPFFGTSVDPPGDPAFYPNSYASLRDLSTLLSADRTRIPLYARQRRWRDTPPTRYTWAPSTPSLAIDGSLFDGYALIGVDETRIADSSDEYAASLARRVAGVVAVASVDGGSSVLPSGGSQPVGSVGVRTVRVPIELVRRYCRLKSKLADLASGPERQQVTDRLETVARRLRDPPKHPGESLLPIAEGRVSELTADRLVSLPSLTAFLEAGLIEESALQQALERQRRASEIWIDPVARAAQRGAVTRQVRLFSHERNEPLLGPRVSDLATYGSGGYLSTLGGPFGVSFVTTYQCGPVETYRSFRALEDAAERGVLDTLSPQGDHRYSVAYPEWYGREIRTVLEAGTTLEVQWPPEPARLRSRGGTEVEPSHGDAIETYLWEGTDEGFDGWGEVLGDAGLVSGDLTAVSGTSDAGVGWYRGRTDWRRVVETYRQGLYDSAGVDLTFVPSRSIR